MEKQLILEAIENAKTLHLQQMHKIENLIKGKEVEDPTPIAKTECLFGKFLYDDQNELYQMLGEQFFHKLDILHEQWHKQYFKIYNIYFNKSGGGFISKLFGSKKIDPLDADKAKLYFVELREITDELIHAIDVSKRRLTALSASKFHN